MRESLCWSCRNAVPSKGAGCSWSIKGKPVDGWRAKLRPLADIEGDSYRVFECPLYEFDEEPDDESGRRSKWLYL